MLGRAYSGTNAGSDIGTHRYAHYSAHHGANQSTDSDANHRTNAEADRCADACTNTGPNHGTHTCASRLRSLSFRCLERLLGQVWWRRAIPHAPRYRDCSQRRPGVPRPR